MLGNSVFLALVGTSSLPWRSIPISSLSEQKKTAAVSVSNLVGTISTARQSRNRPCTHQKSSQPERNFGHSSTASRFSAVQARGRGGTHPYQRWLRLCRDVFFCGNSEFPSRICRASYYDDKISSLKLTLWCAGFVGLAASVRPSRFEDEDKKGASRLACAESWINTGISDEGL
jgi:hypothetical protein